GDDISGTAVQLIVTPQAVKVNYETPLHELESATGSNFPFNYKTVINVADGIDIDNLVVTDTIPAELQLVNGNLSITVTDSLGATLNPVITQTDNDYTFDFGDNISGVADDHDIIIEYNVFIKETYDDDDNPASTEIDVLGNGENDHNIVFDQAAVSASQDITGIALSADTSTNSMSVLAESLAVQKSVNLSNVTPGDTLTYTVDMQISDFVQMDGIVLTDTIPNGQLVDNSFTPTFSLNENGISTASVDLTGYVNVMYNPANGQTTLAINISDALQAAQGNGELTGDFFETDITQTSGTSGQLNYKTTILQEFVNSGLSGNTNLDQGDMMTNTVVINSSGGNISSETVALGNSSNATVRVAQGNLVKSIYAVTRAGVTQTVAGILPNSLSPDDLITYRLTYTMPSCDFDGLMISDFLPHPVIDISANTWAIDGWTNTSIPATPVEGKVYIGPSDSFFLITGTQLGITPGTSISTDSTNNSISFNLGSNNQTGTTPTVIDLLFTTKIKAEPMANDLLLTNIAQSSLENTFGDMFQVTQINQIKLDQPEIVVHKGILDLSNDSPAVISGSNGPASLNAFTGSTAVGANLGSNLTSLLLNSTPLNSDANGVDAGDIITYAVIIENIGDFQAFDVNIQDTLPSGLSYIAGTMQAYLGDGTSLIQDGNPSDLAAAIELADVDATTGRLTEIDDGSTGTNLVVITYQVSVDNSMVSAASMENTATVTSYASKEGGTDFYSVSDQALVNSASPSVSKSITASDQAHTTGNDAAVGEIITYTINVDVNEGIYSTVTLVDQLDAGLEYIGGSAQISVNNATLSSSNGILTIAPQAITPTISADQRTLTFGLANITNTESTTAASEIITLTYNVLVKNDSSVYAGSTHDNSIGWYENGIVKDSAQAASITVLEPLIAVTKTVNDNDADAGDEMTFTVNLQNTGNTTAFDIQFDDILPAGFTYISSTLADVSGVAANNLNEDSKADGGITTGDLQAIWDSLAAGASATIEYKANVDQSVNSSDILTNTANVIWTSLPVDADPNERDGSGGINDYSTSDNTSVTIHSPDLSKQVVATSVNNASNDLTNEVTPGETATYEVTIFIPESDQTLTSSQIKDSLPAGMTIIGNATISSASAGLSSSTIPVLTGASITNTGS
ncbi:MAG: isopeptide-forming domain-containing fimbrial protein, partial [Lentisphaeraceae bacterium]|nr:isopeptide-forming domain-containing fimbrial protein [Lentisphaeraceae bacterium]